MRKRIVGIIAEDISDVNTITILINRISGQSISEKHYVGSGGGRIMNKCHAWANSLYIRKCSVLIVIHDSDENQPKEIYQKIITKLQDSSFSDYLICIPVQEIEAWLLSDPDGIKKALRLNLQPKVKGNPQTIRSPKEYLGSIVRKASENRKMYINTKHNEVIASEISIKNIYDKCTSFRPFHQFIVKKVS